MIRETIIATTNTYTIHFPNNWVGEKVTVIYDTEEKKSDEISKLNNIDLKPSDLFKNYRVDLSNYKFNREDANNYEG
jgi:hypothetical protein